MKRFCIAPLVVAVGFLPASAFAACQQQGGLVCGGAPSLSSPSDVQVSRGGPYRPLDAAHPLRGGDRLLAGAAGTTLSLGPSCSTAIGAGSLVTLSRSGNRTCARVTSAQTASPPPQQAVVDAPGIPRPVLILGGIAGAAGLSAVIYAATSGGRSSHPSVSAQ